MHSIAMLIGQVFELRQQHAAMMDLYHGHRGMSSSPCESTRFKLSQVGTTAQLDALSNALGEDTYRHQLVTYLYSLGGDTVVSFVDKVFGELFSDEITSFITFYGRQQGKRPFFGTALYNLVFGKTCTACMLMDFIIEVFDHWNRGQRSDRHQLERALKNAFKRAYERLLKRQTKANINNSQNPDGDPSTQP
ncbi:hypothetical protein SprV_0501997600 [Sparganum proliferum]